MSVPTLRGVINGKIIELESAPSFPQGQEVLVTIQPTSEQSPEKELPPGEGLRRAFGGWAEDAEDLDEFLAWSRQQRKVGRLPIE